VGTSQVVRLIARLSGWYKHKGEIMKCEKCGQEGTKVNMMTNSELQDAITIANSMVKSTMQDSRTYVPLLQHLNALMKLQQQRAE
jgi:hypothetical protein